jgi:hypothetical protein
MNAFFWISCALLAAAAAGNPADDAEGELTGIFYLKKIFFDIYFTQVHTITMRNKEKNLF